MAMNQYILLRSAWTHNYKLFKKCFLLLLYVTEDQRLVFIGCGADEIDHSQLKW